MQQSRFSDTHCMNCQAGWVRKTAAGKTLLMCLIDRELVLPDLNGCNMFKPKEKA
jgi:hypothetical protein